MELVMEHVGRLNANCGELLSLDIDTLDRAFNALLHYNDHSLDDARRLALLEDIDTVRQHLAGLAMDRTELQDGE